MQKHNDDKYAFREKDLTTDEENVKLLVRLIETYKEDVPIRQNLAVAAGLLKAKIREEKDICINQVNEQTS